jgi:two-component system, chemotaxis family, chemotaxis protein CheY
MTSPPPLKSFSDITARRKREPLPMNKRILIVDDSATVRQQLQVLLRGNGFGVLEAEDGKQGLATATREDVDMLIVDVNMPNMNGIEMVAEVRKLPKHQKTPIFMLTTESTKSVMAMGKTAGATAWIIKPFRPEMLLKGIERVLAVPR